MLTIRLGKFSGGSLIFRLYSLRIRASFVFMARKSDKSDVNEDPQDDAVRETADLIIEIGVQALMEVQKVDRQTAQRCIWVAALRNCILPDSSTR